MSRRSRLRSRLAALHWAALALGSLTACSEKAEPDHTVLLVVVDTLRADRLSCYGFEGHRTEHFDRLAEHGVRFAQAFSAGSWTVPSMGALFTSRYPTQLGLGEAYAEGLRFDWREHRPQRAYTLPTEVTTVAEYFAQAGYRTAAFVDQPALQHGEGFRQGFVDWIEPTGPDTVARRPEGSPAPKRSQEWDTLEHSATIDAALVEALDEWLTATGGKRFAWLHLLMPHVPYNPDPRFLPPGTDLETADRSVLYEAEIRATDELIGTLIETIDRHGGLEDVTLVLVSDHGEELGDHGRYGHGHSLHREVIQVPLILLDPRLPRGVEVRSAVRTIDVLPTLLDLIGAEQAPGSEADEFEGKSLLAAIESEQGRAVYSEAMLYGSTEVSLLEGEYKLMYDQQDTQLRLYSVDRDPFEQNDLANRETKTTMRLRQRLLEMNRQLREDFEAGLGLRQAQGAGAEDPAVQEALRALGYVDD